MAQRAFFGHPDTSLPSLHLEFFQLIQQLGLTRELLRPLVAY